MLVPGFTRTTLTNARYGNATFGQIDPAMVPKLKGLNLLRPEQFGMAISREREDDPKLEAFKIWDHTIAPFRGT